MLCHHFIIGSPQFKCSQNGNGSFFKINIQISKQFCYVDVRLNSKVVIIKNKVHFMRISKIWKLLVLCSMLSEKLRPEWEETWFQVSIKSNQTGKNIPLFHRSAIWVNKNANYFIVCNIFELGVPKMKFYKTWELRISLESKNLGENWNMCLIIAFSDRM